jgi:hypothetical protein
VSLRNRNSTDVFSIESLLPIESNNRLDRGSCQAVRVDRARRDQAHLYQLEHSVVPFHPIRDAPDALSCCAVICFEVAGEVVQRL